MGSAKDRLREYLLANLDKVLTSEELREVGAISEWARRVRELRDEEGFNILTHSDREDLKPGEYLLSDAAPRPAFARSLSKETRAYVRDRNGFTCQMCGVAAGDVHPDDGRKARLHIGHILEKSQGGTDEPENLRALCSLCNEGIANLSLARPDAIRLLAQVRRSAGETQLDVLEWLVQKYPSQAHKVMESD